MAKARSPGYPVIGLQEAVEKISLVYKKDYQNKVPRTVVAQHMGYQSLNGKSLGVLASISKYGLLEGRGEENWVSDLALQIIAHEVGSPERQAALNEAAAAPDLFADIQSKFPNGASDAALRSYLLTRKFLPQAADIAIRSYRETVQLVSSTGEHYPTPYDAKDTREASAAVKQQAIETYNENHSQTPKKEAVGDAREYLRHSLSPDCEVRLFVKGIMTARELRKLRHLIYMSEIWEAEAPSGSELAVDKALDDASKPN